MQGKVQEWTEAGSHDLEELPHIMKAYHTANVEGEYDLLIDMLEEYTLKNFMSMTPSLAAQLIITCGEHLHSAQLVEICEKLIASGLSQMYHQENGAETILLVYQGFLQSKHTRSKIIELLLENITENISKLSIESQCAFVGSLTSIVDEVASMSQGRVNEGSKVEGILSTIEPYLLDKLSLLTLEDLTNTFVGFSHPHLP